MERVYENIKTLRSLHRHTQKYVADELDIAQSHYSRLERGLIDMPLSLLIRISAFYNVTVEKLIHDDLERTYRQMLV